MFLRLLDFFLSLIGILILFPLLIIITILGYFENRSPIFRQTRVGRNKRAFTLYKFRTMKISTQSVATHLVDSNNVTKWGSFLRKTKIDELPQLINVLKGEMSLVGPRPCLFNQEELIKQRELQNVFNIRPGITGLAQIQGVDMSNPEKLALIDGDMAKNITVINYFKYIVLTVMGRGSGDRIQKNIN